MFGKSFKGKIILPAVGVLVVLTVVLTSYVSVRFLEHSNALIDEKIAVNTQSLEFYLKSRANDSKVAAMSMVHNIDAIAAIKAQDRGRILEVFTPTLELYHIDFYTITDENGIVLARTHDPNRFGDSILEQHNIQDALADQVSTYFEAGTAIKVSVRTGAPVHDANGTLIGVISAGIRYDTEKAVDLMKKFFKSDITVYFEKTRVSTTVRDKTGERITGTLMDQQVANIVVDTKTTYSGNTVIADIRYRVVYIPLFDTDEDVKVVLALGNSLEELKSQTNLLIRNIFVISAVGLAVSIVALYWVISTISKPILNLAKEMQKMEGGKLSVLIDAASNDEVGYAGKSLQKVADILHKLIDDIGVAISEHERGNAEYRLDLSGFHGAYRLLAERIVELSRLGMNDPLTELPNRRSFDNRLEIEWNRAMRDQTSLSMLMLDVDKFKTYNDSFGHQQGDAVLQAVAQAIPLPIKRGHDIVARYGGEEFVVLLPNTDSEGALHVAEMIRAGVENTPIPSTDGGQAKRVTVSIGTVTMKPTTEESMDALVAHADAALYQAKESGRNRVCQYGGNG